MTSAQRTAIGLSLTAMGTILGLVGCLIAWNAAQRWMAVNEVREALSLIRHSGRFEEARRIAAVAMTRAPDAAVPALVAADLTKLESVDRFEGLAARCELRSERETLLAALGLARALAGKPIEVDLENTGDGRMIAAILASRKGTQVGKLWGQDETPAHLSVVKATCTLLARKAWEEGQAEDLRRHLGALILLDPRPTQKEGPVAALMLAAFDTSSKARSVDVLRLAGEIPAETRPQVLKALVAIAPHRRSLLEVQYAKDLGGAP